MYWRCTASALAVLFAATVASTAAAGALEGSAWRLLNISSMDDTVAVPDDPSDYTLSFNPENQASMKADCNRGTGRWTSKPPSGLTFGPIAATRALCSPQSLSERYLQELGWVRSYVMRDGHLFLATMADGSILEFEPLPPAVATVFGEPVHAADASELQTVLATQLLTRYAAQHNLAVEDTELDAYLAALQHSEAEETVTSESDLSPAEAQQVEAMRRTLGHALILQWKINKSLYDTYGGRIIYQQFGPEPLDAYRQYFEARQAAGDFTIDDAAMAKQFWHYFKDESLHDFMAPGGEDATHAFTTPPWQPNSDTWARGLSRE